MKINLHKINKLLVELKQKINQLETEFKNL